MAISICGVSSPAITAEFSDAILARAGRTRQVAALLQPLRASTYALVFWHRAGWFDLHSAVAEVRSLSNWVDAQERMRSREIGLDELKIMREMCDESMRRLLIAEREFRRVGSDPELVSAVERALEDERNIRERLDRARHGDDPPRTTTAHSSGRGVTVRVGA